MTTPNPTPTTLRNLLGEIVYPMIGPECTTLDKHDFPDLKASERCLNCAVYEEIDQATQSIQEQLKALLPPKSTKSEWRKKYNIKSDEMWDDGFDHAIELVEEAIDDFCSGKGKE